MWLRCYSKTVTLTVTKPKLIQNRAARQDDYRLRDTQRQVDEVVGIMRGNVEKVLERDQKLGDLEDKSGLTDS